MRLPRPGTDARPGETSEEHIRRVTRLMLPEYTWAPKVLGAYVVKLLKRVEDLERRVAELERRTDATT